MALVLVVKNKKSLWHSSNLTQTVHNLNNYDRITCHITTATYSAGGYRYGERTSLQDHTKQQLNFHPLKYRPELDGIRAFAVIPVVLYHFNLSFPGGFAGVDVFFVISGYLISAILLNHLETKKFSFTRFYHRRCRRLFPASTFMLLVILITSHFLLLKEKYKLASQQANAVLLFGANFHFYLTTESYFHDPLEIPFLHCWSLALEEQYYFLFPPLLWFLWFCCSGCSSTSSTNSSNGNGSKLQTQSKQSQSQSQSQHQRTVILIGFGLFFISSFIAGIVLSTSNQMFAFYLLPCRAWEMIMGGLLVVIESYIKSSTFCVSKLTTDCQTLPSSCSNTISPLPKTLSPEPPPPPSSSPSLLSVPSFISPPPSSCCVHWVREALGIVGVIMITISYFLFDYDTKYPSFNALLPCMGTILFIVSNTSLYVVANQTPRTYLGCLFATKPFVFIGKISYSIYLWHWPTFVLLMNASVTDANNNLTPAMTILGLLVSFLGGAFSFYFIEEPFRIRKKKKTNKSSNNSNNNNKISTSTSTKTISTSSKIDISIVVIWIAMLLFTALGGDAFGIPFQEIPTSTNNTSIKKNCTKEEDAKYWLNVPTSDISTGNILASKGWTAACPYSTGPVYAGPVDKEVSMVFFGTSHLEMFCGLIMKLAEEFQVRIAFIARGGDYGRFFEDPTFMPRINVAPDGETWDAYRLNLLNTWNGGVEGNKLNKIVRFDFWGGERPNDLWFPNWRADPSEPTTLPGGKYDFKYEMKVLSQYTAKLLYFGDVPSPESPKLPSSSGFKNWCYQQYKSTESWEFLQSLKETPLFKARRINAERDIREAAANQNQIYFHEIASLFENLDGDLQVVDRLTGRLVYKDYSHVNVDGEKRLEHRFRKYIFDQPVCEAGNSSTSTINRTYT